MKKFISGLLALMLLVPSSVYADMGTNSTIDLPGDPLSDFKIGMSLTDFVKVCPSARSGLLANPIDLKNPDQTLFISNQFYSQMETIMFHFRNNSLQGVDYTVFVDNEDEYKTVLGKFRQHFQSKRGKEIERYGVEERGRKNYVAGCLDWGDNPSQIGVEFLPPEMVGNDYRKGFILIHFSDKSFGSGLPAMRKKQKALSNKGMNKLLREAE